MRTLLIIGGIIVAGLGVYLALSLSGSSSDEGSNSDDDEQLARSSRRERPALSDREARQAHVAKQQTAFNIRSAFSDKKYAEVLEKTEAILSESPDDETARAYAAMSACAVGRKDKAQNHADKLVDKRYSFVSTRCRTLGVPLDPRD